MSKSILNTLTLSKVPEKSKDPIVKRRNKLLEKLEMQREMARCMLEEVTFSVFREKWVTDPETGEKTKARVPKRVRPWYYKSEGNYYIQIFYGNKPLELAKGKAAVMVDCEDDLLPVFDKITEAVGKGELDDQLSKIKAPVMKKS
ncbi:DUF6641 family protein [uncultured Microbulbifer sp.]|uniref:DUF6641 family protein n=1 Tax=uncultured Microbulbifer sp. TaxID=348147 RepID=UPI00261493C0|nr:DUF6641 family protein [uncultured Microbulbifer sp.]